MKKILALFAALFLSGAYALGQQTGCSQLNLKTDGGLGCGSSDDLSTKVTQATTAPTSPVTGQLWCDTTTTPCTLKTYDGASWNAANTLSTINTQTDVSSFPGSPTDGQIFWDKSHYRIWVYDSSSGKWCSADGAGSCTGANIVDSFSGTPITAPSAGMTIADGGAGGNFGAGTGTKCEVTFANSTGGETTPTATTGANITASHKIQFSSVPTGGTGTTQRRFYCTKGAANGTGLYYWVDTLNDNSTTSLLSSGLSDANMKIEAPNVNYSAALNARWTYENRTANTTSGGCGATGGSLVCRIPTGTIPSNQGATTDPYNLLRMDLSSYNSGNYTIKFRLVSAYTGFTSTNVIASTPDIAFLQAGGGASGQIETGIYGSSSLTNAALGVTNVWGFNYGNRTTTSGGFSNVGGLVASVQRISAFPLWVQVVKYGNSHNWYYSKDGNTWQQALANTTCCNPTDAQLGIVPSVLFDTLILWYGAGNAAQTVDMVTVMDNFSLTVN